MTKESGSKKFKTKQKKKKHGLFTFHSPQPYSFISFVLILSKALEDCYVAVEGYIKNENKQSFSTVIVNIFHLLNLRYK